MDRSVIIGLTFQRYSEQVEVERAEKKLKI